MNTTEEEPEIFLFTTEFPFGKGEQFLESEILVLSAFTDKLTVVPSRIGGKQRALPKNIKLDLTFAQSFPSTKKKIIDLCNLKIFKLIFQNENLKNASNPFNLAKTARAAYNAEKAKEWAINKFKRSKGKVVFYSYWLEFYTFGLCLYAIENKDIKIISRVHNYDLYEFRYPFNYIPFRKKVLEYIDKVFPISKNGKEYLNSKYPLLANKFSFYPLGTFDFGENPGVFEENRLHILSCSLLNKVKRVHIIVQVIHALAAENPNLILEWTHIGGGKLMKKIKGLVKTKNFNNLKVNLKGNQTNRYVLEFYKTNRVDIFINVSSVEGIPVSIMEAQSCGIPVVATAVGGTPEIVNNTNGILLSPNPKIEEVKEAVKKFTNYKFQLQKRIKSRENWEKEFNAKKNYTRFYKEISHLH